jgi:protein-tyrosine phosphatase
MAGQPIVAASVIDLHCHVLPAIDDGPRDLAGSLALARAAVAGGTSTIVATPHVSWGYPEVSADVVAHRVDEVNAALRREGIDLEVRPGAEVALTRGIELPDEELARVHLGGGPWLLLEAPLEQVGSATFEAAALQLAGRGHRIVVAHPERSPLFQRDPDALGRLVAAGMLGQLTASSLTGRFGRLVRDTAWAMLARGHAHNVATDAHSADGQRSPGLGEELAAAGIGEAWADHLGRAVPLAIVTGTPVPPPPGPPPRPAGERGKGLLGRLGLRRA